MCNKLNFGFTLNLFLLHVTLFLFYSCKQSKILLKNFVFINPQESLESQWLDTNITENIKYLPLESPYKSPLGTISRCIVIDSFFISIYRDRSSIFFHSLNGKLDFVLNAEGKGPFEFEEVNEIAKFDENHILINDPSKQSILKYNFRTKKIVKEYKTNVDIFSMYYQNEQLIYIGNNFKKGILQIVHNFNFDACKTLMIGTDISNFVVSGHAFQPIDKSKILINVSFLDTMIIYNFDRKTIDKRYIIGSEETSMTRIAASEISQMYKLNNFKRIEGILIPWGFISKIKNHIIIPVSPINKCIILNLETDASYFFDFQHNIGKLSYTESGAYPNILHNDGNIYYSLIHMLSEKKPQKDKDLKLDYIDEYNKLLNDKFENPVIVKFEMK